MDNILAGVCDNLKLATQRLQLISSHDALLLLKNCLGGPKLQYVLRTSQCCNHPLLRQFDDLLRSAVTRICNVSLSDDQWLQASLPVRHGGLGVRSVSMLASSAFLASAAGTQKLQNLILQRSQVDSEDVSKSTDHWKSIASPTEPVNLLESSQRRWDDTASNQTFQVLLDAQTEPFHRARLLAAAAPHSSDWLHALPISACGLRLSDEAVRVAVGLRLGTTLCQAHECPCGAKVDERGTHSLSCKRNPGRAQRHHYLNDMIWRAMTSASIPAVKEPHGLVRSDGKRPDGLTLVPWREGRSATWDVTVTDTVAASYVLASSTCAASAAEAAAQRKELKYSEISSSHHFFPLAIETLGPINAEGQRFISELGHRITAVTDDPRETSFLFQRLSVAIQRYNAVSLANSFQISDANDDNFCTTSLPKHT